MLLGVRPVVFFARLLGFFLLTYLAWAPIAPAYTSLLGVLTQWAISATELFGTAATRAATSVVTRGNGIFFFHKQFPGLTPPGVPGDWVQANMVLLIPLMLATPAPTIRARLVRLAIALAAALCLQVLGLVVNVKTLWSSQLGPYSAMHYTWVQRRGYQFADAFFQSFDTQLFPVVIWAGIHFRQLLRLAQTMPQEMKSRAEARQAARTERKKQGKRR